MYVRSYISLINLYLHSSPGMMQSGLSRELFESWCTDKKSGVIIAGYCVEGTLAKVAIIFT